MRFVLPLELWITEFRGKSCSVVCKLRLISSSLFPRIRPLCTALPLLSIDNGDVFLSDLFHIVRYIFFVSRISLLLRIVTRDILVNRVVLVKFLLVCLRILVFIHNLFCGWLLLPRIISSLIAFSRHLIVTFVQVWALRLIIVLKLLLGISSALTPYEVRLLNMAWTYSVPIPLRIVTCVSRILMFWYLLRRVLLACTMSSVVNAYLHVPICIPTLVRCIKDIGRLVWLSLLHCLSVSRINWVCFSLSRHLFVTLTCACFLFRRAVASSLITIPCHLLCTLTGWAHLWPILLSISVLDLRAVCRI